MYKNTEWKDKVVQYPHRYRETANADGSVDHILEPGSVTQEGTPLSADNFNNMEGGIMDVNMEAAIIMQAVRQLGECAGSPLNKNALYRGKNLGTVTPDNIDAFSAEHGIKQGIFHDLFLGDYFVLEDGTYNIEWMIAGFDLDYNCGSSSEYLITDHCITIVPRGPGLTKTRIHSSASAAGGYWNSEIRTTIETVTGVFETAFGSHIVYGACLYCTNAVASGKVSGIMGGSTKCVLMNEAEIYGCLNLGLPMSNHGGLRLLPLFRFINPDAYSDDYDGFWLINPYSDTEFCRTRHKHAAPHHASVTSTGYWLRPKMTIA